MTVGERIKSKRTSQGLSQIALADKICVSKQTLYKYENGIITNIPSDKIEEIANVLNTTPAYLMGWEASSSFDVSSLSNYHQIEKKPIPVLGSIACGKPIFANQEYDSFILMDASLNADYALTAQGDSMINARIFDGDAVFIKQQDMVDNGEIAAVCIDDEVTLKRVYYYPESQTLMLQPENPQYKPLTFSGEELDHVHILGKAVFFQSIVR